MQVDDEVLEPVSYLVGSLVVKFKDLLHPGVVITEGILKTQFREAETKIKHQQRLVKEDGYIIMKDVVYCVSHAGTPTRKITGDVAKAVKRQLKLS